MTTRIALLRGINIGGNHLLPMKQLKDLLEQLGCSEVRTYIQSGNVVFRSAADATTVERDLTAAIDASHGFAPRVLVLSAEEFAATAAANPFAAAVDAAKTVHQFFLAAPTKATTTAFAALATTERFEVHDRCFYLHTPDGFGKSKLAERAERLLGVAATARNWRTVSTLVEMSRTGA